MQISYIAGRKEMLKNVSGREQKDMLGLDASSSVSESLRACTKGLQKECGPSARIDRLAAVGQSQFNNDSGRVQQLVTGQKSQTEDGNPKEQGDFH